jgi:hypothetical protein
MGFVALGIAALARCCLSERTRSVNGRQYLRRAVTALAEPAGALYLERRDQNVSHLMVFAGGRASLLAR